MGCRLVGHRHGQGCTSCEDYFRVLWVGDLWEQATFVRGMEQILMELVLNPLCWNLIRNTALVVSCDADACYVGLREIVSLEEERFSCVFGQRV